MDKRVEFCVNVVVFWLLLLAIGVTIVGFGQLQDDMGWTVLLGGTALAYIVQTVDKY